MVFLTTSKCFFCSKPMLLSRYFITLTYLVFTGFFFETLKNLELWLT